jgi:hypothetical protein
MTEPIQPTGKKRFTKFKLALYLLAALGLVWLGVQAYWGFFKLKLWLAGFGNGAFWILGLIGGFVYFHAIHRIQERIKGMPQRFQKAAAYAAFCLGLIVANPLPWSLALWIFWPPGGLKTIGHWFFLGSSLAAAIVIVLERIFTKKTPPPTKGES